MKHTINNWADKLSKLQHDTRMRASQPQITERSFQRPHAVKNNIITDDTRRGGAYHNYIFFNVCAIKCVFVLIYDGIECVCQ